MTKYYLVKVGSSFTVYTNKNEVPSKYLPNLIEVDNLPEGTGVLKVDENGKLYFELVDHLPQSNVIVNTPSISKNIDQALKMLSEQQQQNLVLMDINLGLYEMLVELIMRLDDAE